MQEVKLKNGSTEADVLVTTVMISIRSLFENGIQGLCDVYDFGSIARGEDNPAITRKTVERLTDLGLMNKDGSMHQSIRNIAISAIDQDGNLSSPLA